MQTIDLRIHSKQDYEIIGDIQFISKKYKITVYKGLRYNSASIPRALWSIIGCPIDYAFEAALHDPLYGSRLLSRRECDVVFYEALILQGVPREKAIPMYLAVRKGGQSNYDEAITNASYYREFIKVEFNG